MPVPKQVPSEEAAMRSIRLLSEKEPCPGCHKQPLEALFGQRLKISTSVDSGAWDLTPDSFFLNPQAPLRNIAGQAGISS